ncbi:MAG: TonB-dependent receptor [Cyanobacteria bacterium P01_D01_bin.128]
MTIQTTWLSCGVLTHFALAGIAYPAFAQASIEAQNSITLETQGTAIDSQPLNPVAQAEAAIITDVQISSTSEGLDIVLVSDRPLSPGASQISGNALIVEIPNASLELIDPAVAEQFAPVEGIALVQVLSLPNGAVQVSVTGAEAPPVAEVSVEASNLVLSVVPGVATASGDDLEAIQVIVTATRTEETVLDIPRSVTVIEREQIEQQLQFTNNLPDILGRLVPGLSPPTLQTTTRGFTLRGRNAQVLIDGVPQNLNSGAGPELNGIAPDSIERIEVVPGASAIYGDGATGGVINIITRAPIESGVVYDVSAGTRVGLTSLQGDSFSYNVGLGVAAADNNLDGRLMLTYDANNARFDAGGNRIPPETGISDSDRVSLLAKLGYDINQEQRLAFTYSFYQDTLDTVFATDRSIFAIPGNQVARAVEIGAINYDATPQLTNHILNLTYRHANLLGSQLDIQTYYRDLEQAGTFSDLRPLGFPFATFPDIFQDRSTLSEWGARAQVETPLGSTASLLWGADYTQETNEIAALFLDAAAFDASRTLNIVDQFSLFPRYELNSLGLFAQARWDITEQFQISGGVRYDDFDFSVGDYQLAFALAAPRDRQGGSGGASDVSFNAGLLYRPVPEIGLFANFSQGFSIPNLGSVFSAAAPTFDISTDLALTPQEVNNFEVGLRAELDQLQVSLAGFYSESDLGSAIVFNPATGFSELVRAPQRNYGLEAAIDWQASDTWQLGGFFSWSEGENDVNNDGEFLALGSLNVPPYKLGLYLENETTPGWTNRLQMLLVGDRDRAFIDGVDPFTVNSYVTLDLLSSIQLGQGRLTVGIENLLNTNYLPLTSQERVGGFEERRYAAPGTTLSVRYSIQF